MSIADKTAPAIQATAYRRPALGRHALEPFAALTDGVLILLSGTLSTIAYQSLVLGLDADTLDFSSFTAISLLASVLFVTISKSQGAYETYIFSGQAHSLRKTLALWAGVVALLTIAAFLLKIGSYFSRGSSVIFTLSGAAVLATNRIVWRHAVNWLLQNNILFVTRAMVVRVRPPQVDASNVDEIRRRMDLRRNGITTQQQIIMPIDGDNDARATALGYIQRQVASGHVDEILIGLDHKDLNRLDDITEALRIVPVPVRFMLDPVTQSIAAKPMKQIGNILLTEVQRAPLSVLERMTKRLLDIVVASSALMMLSPLMMLTAIMIKLDSKGPVFFFQDRRGFSGKVFKIIKFRSMTAQDNGPTIVQASKNDMRVTRVGRFIRRTSIDELPQLWNVLKGDMSIVGPRPHAVAHDDYYSRFIADYAFRHHTKPGLTGLAQVNGLRGETPEMTDMRERIEMDVAYINNWSLQQDVVIILRTALVLFGQRNAY